MWFMYQDSVHANDVNWQPARFPGVYLKILHGNPESEASVVLRKLEPNAVIPKHYHAETDETVYVLDGDFIEDEKAYGLGHVFFAKATFPHGPRTTAKGCIVLTVFSAKLDVHVVD
jgi:quercetin dioxygenase-like cupin family protein